MAGEKALQRYTGWSPSNIRAAIAELELVREIGIPKGSGKGVRTINVPPPRLKEFLRILHRVFQGSYFGDFIVQDIELAQSVHGFLPCVSSVTNAQMHQNSQEFFLCDFSNAFGQVTSDVVRGIFRDFYDHLPSEMIDLIVRLVTHSGSLPQGFPTSPVFLNLACYELDKQLIDLVSSSGIVYTRYADDLCFSTQKKEVLDIAIPLIKSVIEKHFNLAPHKFRRLSLSRGAVEITGVCVLPPLEGGTENRIGLSRKKIKSFRSALEHCLRDELSTDVARGIIGWVRHVYKGGSLPAQIQGPFLKLLKAGKLSY